jgi:putative addiction module component (TIGR02574 family)
VTAFEALLAQALQLPDDERGKLAARLLGSLEPEAEELSPQEWEEAWSAEVDHRLREVRDGSVDTVDGADARARVRAALDALRP